MRKGVRVIGWVTDRSQDGACLRLHDHHGPAFGTIRLQRPLQFLLGNVLDAPIQRQDQVGASLSYPGDFLAKYPGSSADVNHGDGDGLLEIGEQVHGTSAINIDDLQLLDNRRPAIIIYDNKNGNHYRAYGFANIEVLGFNNIDNWFLFRIIQWPAEQCITDQ